MLGAVAHASAESHCFRGFVFVSVAAALLIAIGTSACMFTLGAAWGTCIEIGRNHVGVVGATMNTAGQIASLMCPLIVAYSVDWFDKLGLAAGFSLCSSWGGRVAGS